MSYNRGFGLPDLMIGVAISSVIAGGTVTFMNRQQKMQADLQYAETMKAVAKQIEIAIGKPEVLLASSKYSSSAGNTELKKCITYVTEDSTKQGQKEPCVATDPSRQVSFELVLPFSGQGDNIEAREIYKHTIAGTEEKPVRYSLRDGKRCDAQGHNEATGDCQLEAKAYFWASCGAESLFQDQVANGGQSNLTGTSCPTAQSINVRYQVVHKNKEAQNDTTSQKKLVTTQQLPSIPSDSLFYKAVGVMSTFGAIVTSVAKIPSTSNLLLDACGPNYTLVKVVNGKAQCACLYPYREQVADLIKTCVPRDKLCKSNERYRGTDESGNIICKPVTCIPNVPIDVGCGNGGWIESVIPGIMSNKFQPDWQSACTSTICHVDKDGGDCEAEVMCLVGVTCCYESTPPAALVTPTTTASP